MTGLETVDHDTVYDVAVEVTAIRTAPSDPTPVLEVTDRVENTRCLVCTPASPGQSVNWAVGEWYRLERVVGCDPRRPLADTTARRRQRLESSPHVPTVASTVDADHCPNCGGQLELANTLVLPAVVRETIAHCHTEFLLVCTDTSTVEPLDEAPGSDSESVVTSQPPSRVVCADCGCVVREYYR